MKPPILIRPARESDVPALARLYNHYVTQSTSTYVEKELTDGQMLEKYRHITEGYPFLVAEREDGSLAGYAYVDRFRPQSAWKLVETTIYLSPEAKGQGIGRLLYGSLIPAVKEMEDVIGMVAVITLENSESIRFHESLGFNLAGRLPDCAVKFGNSIGSGFWLLRLREPS